MTSGRSGLRLLRPDDGHFASWCGSCAKARRSLGIRALEGTQMRKTSLVAAIALMLAGAGVWATSITRARVDVPADAQIKKQISSRLCAIPVNRETWIQPSRSVTRKT